MNKIVVETFAKNLHGREIIPCRCGGKYLVNAAGYIPTKARVEQYLAAGRSLKAYQESVDWNDYDDPEEAENAGVPLDREHDLDAADVHQMEIAAVAEMRKKKRESKEQIEVEAKSAEEPKAPEVQPPAQASQSKSE